MRWFLFVGSIIVFLIGLVFTVASWSADDSPSMECGASSSPCTVGAAFSAYFNGLEIFGEGL